MSNPDLIVIGAGAAGLLAAGTAAERGFHVLLADKNALPGKKLMITGKGRCNVTNNCSIDEFMANIPVNARFLYGAFSRFSSKDTMDFFERQGVSLKTERGRRVFPVSDRAADITDALVRFCKSNGVQFVTDKINSLIVEGNAVQGVLSEKREYFAKSVIIATGGKSYPGTGSTGDGFKMAKETGHKVVEAKPSLVPLVSKDSFCREMMGLSLRNVAEKVRNNKTKKVIYKDFGEMLFTHFGVSGPVVLSASSHMRKMEEGLYTLLIDLKPALSEQELDSRLLKDFNKNVNRNFGNSLDALLPNKMINVIVTQSPIDSDKKVNQITKEERLALVALLKNFPVQIAGFRPISEAIITSGGVAVNQINPVTMESKLVKGLYFVGEVLDVDAHTGGYNLQIAFSTGYCAGISILED